MCSFTFDASEERVILTTCTPLKTDINQTYQITKLFAYWNNPHLLKYSGKFTDKALLIALLRHLTDMFVC